MLCPCKSPGVAFVCLMQDFVDALQRVGPPMGFNVGRPNTVQLENDRTDNFLKNIRNNLSQTTQMVSMPTSVCELIAPSLLITRLLVSQF